jgi:hypothetical protein
MSPLTFSGDRASATRGTDLPWQGPGTYQEDGPECWADGIVLGIDADLPRASDPPLAELARQTRDQVDLDLGTPWTMNHSDGRVQQVPPIDGRFKLDRVLLRTDTVPPEIHILFRWAGEQVLFGVREAVVQDDDDLQFLGVTLASMIIVSLEEDLLASGYGIENAIREPQGNVTWLRWNTGPSAQ